MALLVVGYIIWGGTPAEKLSDNQPYGGGSETVLVVYVGVWIAFLSIAASTWSQWRTTSIQHAVSALQSMRTGPHFHQCAIKIRHDLGGFDNQLSAQQADDFMRSKPSEDPGKPSLKDASLFVLNQYEIIAAAVRQGVMDLGLVRSTVRGNVCGLVKMYLPVIWRIRKKNPKAFEHLLWLAERFEDN